MLPCAINVDPMVGYSGACIDIGDMEVVSKEQSVPVYNENVGALMYNTDTTGPQLAEKLAGPGNAMDNNSLASKVTSKFVDPWDDYFVVVISSQPFAIKWSSAIAGTPVAFIDCNGVWLNCLFALMSPARSGRSSITWTRTSTCGLRFAAMILERSKP
jgi:hypothetical protein